jgi:hypothetical protein
MLFAFDTIHGFRTVFSRPDAGVHLVHLVGDDEIPVDLGGGLGDVLVARRAVKSFLGDLTSSTVIALEITPAFPVVPDLVVDIEGDLFELFSDRLQMFAKIDQLPSTAKQRLLFLTPHGSLSSSPPNASVGY